VGAQARGEAGASTQRRGDAEENAEKTSEDFDARVFPEWGAEEAEITEGLRYGFPNR
jgi:hypothetical protein